MTILTRRSVLRSSLPIGAIGTSARPHIADAAATTAEMWWAQGSPKAEATSLKRMVADYEKATSDSR